MTLIELLITVTIIAILSAVFLGASRSAMESARAARTKTTITKIHGLLMERWASYATRRVEVNPVIANAINSVVSDPRVRGQVLMDVNLLAIRELMKLEMPDRWSDVVLNGIPDQNPKNVLPGDRRVLASLPSLTAAYRRRFANLRDKDDNGDDIDGTIIRRFQGAECLYMIVMLGTGDGEARTLFNQRDIGDTDGDGAPEFLDGWGQPIRFIRWPAGFVSDLQPIDPVSGNRYSDQDHDPFDYFRRDQEGVTFPTSGTYPSSIQAQIAGLRNRNNNQFISAYRMVPLIYSPGPDGDADVLVDTGTIPPDASVLDPYAPVFGRNQDLQLATTVDIDQPANGDGWIDNIHNHLMDNR